MAKAQKTQAFEQQLMRLEEIVDLLDRGELPLQEMTQLYEEGMKLLQTCHSYLSTTEQKIMIIQSSYTTGGQLTDVPLTQTEDAQDQLYL